MLSPNNQGHIPAHAADNPPKVGHFGPDFQEACSDDKADRRVSDRQARLREPFLVPPIAERHRDPVVQECVRRFVRLYGCRRALRRALTDPRGGLLLPAFPELLQRPPKRARKGDSAPEEAPDFERRRADGMEAMIRVLLAIVACTDWVTMEIRDPRGGFLSVARLAELACLPVRWVPADEEHHRSRQRFDRTERALRTLRTAAVIAFTKQHRELLPDGHYTSTAPALRKLAVGLFRKFGGHLLRMFEARREKLRRERERDVPRTGDLRVAAIVRGMARGPFQGFAPKPPGTAEAPSARRGPTPQAIIDEVYAEHPEWEFAEIIAEARRRVDRGPAAS